MMSFLEQAPWYLSVVMVLFSTSAVAILGLLIVRNSTNKGHFKEHHDVAGFTFGIVGVIYAVLLSYIVVDVHDRFNQIHQNITLEANLAVELYRDSEVFPEVVRDNIKNQIHQYIEAMANGESEFDSEGKVTTKTHNAVSALWQAYYDFEPVSNREKIWYSESVKKLNDFNRARLLRFFNSNTSIGSMMWTILIVGACTTISFMYFFRVENVWYQATITALLASFIALMLFLIQSMDTVFSGDQRVSTENFIEARQFLQFVDQKTK